MSHADYRAQLGRAQAEKMTDAEIAEALGIDGFLSWDVQAALHDVTEALWVPTDDAPVYPAEWRESDLDATRAHRSAFAAELERRKTEPYQEPLPLW